MNDIGYGPLHIIDNKGAYPAKVLNSAGTLLGFVYGGVVSHISLIDNSTAAGTWTIENNELVGASAQFLTTSMNTITACVALDSSREYIQGYNGSGHLVGVVYDKSTNSFGNVTAIRTVGGGSNYQSPAVLAGTDKILCCSCGNGAATFEAVVLSISGTTITVNTAATATLSANISAFADGCGLIAVGSSFVTSYTVATPAAQIRALSISGMTVTIGSATVLDGTAGGLIAASGSVVIAASTVTTTLMIRPYTVSGSTLSAGTGANPTPAGNRTLNKLFPLGSRWVALNKDTSLGVCAAIASLSSTTITITEANSLVSFNLTDAIVVGSNKVLMLGDGGGSNANILTDTAGTASAGTAITLSSGTARSCYYVDGTDVFVKEGSTGSEAPVFSIVDCSGASPVRSKFWPAGSSAYPASLPISSVSNSVLRRTASMVFGTRYAYVIPSNINDSSNSLSAEISNHFVRLRPAVYTYAAGAYYGKSDSERWVINSSSNILQKVECVQ